ncbi:MAG: hypothetical protein RLZZ301_516 [Bacteroidota bacterium]|jgi:diaminopimelate epimerase
MRRTFTKYQGTGNDFILIDATAPDADILSSADIIALCDRKFGVGADGLIYLTLCQNADFEMHYFNADASQSFCGNGARCAVAFAKAIGLISDHTHFKAIDGFHQATIDANGVRLRMNDVQGIAQIHGHFNLHTGSPHYVLLDADHSHAHVVEIGKSIRYSPRFNAEGINVNLLSLEEGGIRVATYERGVEDETLSCGTGVTAAALVFNELTQNTQQSVAVQTKGGSLKVEWTQVGPGHYQDIYLSGPAQAVFKGVYPC